MKIGVQLYTLRNELSKDFIGTMKEVADLGYEAVEFAGFYDIEANDMKKILADLNLSVVGSHTAFELLENYLDEVMSYNKTIGNQNIVIPSTPLSSYEYLEEVVPKIIEIEESLRKAGFRLHYHNHAHELVVHEGKLLLDALFERIPHLYAEIDTHWVERANVNPVDYVKKYKGRNTLVHLKDLVKEKDRMDYAPLGKGCMDLKSIIQASKDNEVEAVIVENDAPKNGGINDISISIEYLKEVIK